MTLLEAAEAGGLPIESGCRMGVCGADPVCVKDGMEHLSAISDDERSTLDRLGLADNTRMACCARVQGPVTMSLEPEKPGQAVALADRAVLATTARSSASSCSATGSRASPPPTTCAGATRSRRSTSSPTRPHHLYNRMGIARLIYGRSAMQGLYLNPDEWYEEHGDHAVAQHARAADRPGRQAGAARHGRGAAATTG